MPAFFTSQMDAGSDTSPAAEPGKTTPGLHSDVQRPRWSGYHSGSSAYGRRRTQTALFDRLAGRAVFALVPCDWSIP